MKKLIFLFAFVLIALNLHAQDVERKLPQEWKNLVNGGSFVDRLESMPILSNLTKNTWGCAAVLPRDTLNGIEDPAWSYWGGRFFKTKDGKYNSFICRWPENHEKGHWAYHYSEVVHIQSDSPLGPYKPIGASMGLGHNPEIFQLKDGRWMLYVVGEGHYIKYYLANSLNGPWKTERYTFDLRDRRKLRFMVNMTFVKREDGSILTIPRAGDVWISETGTSPYLRVGNESSYPPVEGKYEDPVMWKDHIQYHMIVNDWYGRIAYYQRSKDGIHWKADPGTAYKPGVSRYEDGTVTTWYKYERPRVFQDEFGRATQINFAVIDSSKHADFPNDHHNSKNISIPLTVGRLLEIQNKEAIDQDTKEIKVLIQAEKGFDPKKDLDFESLRFGASEVVNFGNGSKLKSYKKKGKNVLLIFDGQGNGFQSHNFAGKLLGKTKQGKLLFGYSRLPGIDYLAPILSTRKPFFNEQRKLVCEIQNFGLTKSMPSKVIMKFTVGTKTYTCNAAAPALDPYEKAIITFDNKSDLNKDSKGDLKIYVEGQSGHLLYAQKTPVNLDTTGDQIFKGEGKPLSIKEHLKKGDITTHDAKGKHHVNYHVYVPNSFDPQKAPPIIIAFSPGGNGKGILQKILPAAEKMGWIAVGCDSLRNGMKDQTLEVELEDVLINDILKTIPHNKNRIYLAGFSGGAMRSYGISVRREEKYAGILAFGGWLGGPDYQDEDYPARLSVAMVNGNMDRGANAWIVKDTETLRKRGCNIKHFSFIGGHKVAPSEVVLQSMKWLDQSYKCKTKPEKSTDLIPLSILYIGNEGKRSDDFTSFLTSHFKNVESSSSQLFSFEDLNDADVIVVDKPVTNFPTAISKAMIITGPNTEATCRRFGSKFNHLKSGLKNEATNVNALQTIFNRPLKVNPEPLAQKTWMVQNESNQAGFVLNKSNFNDASDSEILAEGKMQSAKADVSIVREANRLFWGFSGSPFQMTESAKQAFINAIVWMHTFDGHQQTSFEGITKRSEIKSILANKENKGEKLEKWFTKDLLKETDYNKEKLLNYINNNASYIYMPYGGGQLDIDEDAQQLRTPNNQLSSVEKWIELLKNRQTKKQALGLLLRYTDFRSRNVKSWQEWYDQNKDKLIFSDEKGYRFILR